MTLAPTKNQQYISCCTKVKVNFEQIVLSEYQHIVSFGYFICTLLLMCGCQNESEVWTWLIETFTYIPWYSFGEMVVYKYCSHCVKKDKLRLIFLLLKEKPHYLWLGCKIHLPNIRSVVLDAVKIPRVSFPWVYSWTTWSSRTGDGDAFSLKMILYNK